MFFRVYLAMIRFHSLVDRASVMSLNAEKDFILQFWKKNIRCDSRWGTLALFTLADVTVQKRRIIRPINRNNPSNSHPIGMCVNIHTWLPMSNYISIDHRFGRLPSSESRLHRNLSDNCWHRCRSHWWSRAVCVQTRSHWYWCPLRSSRSYRFAKVCMGTLQRNDCHTSLRQYSSIALESAETIFPVRYSFS